MVPKKTDDPHNISIRSAEFDPYGIQFKPECFYYPIYLF